MCWNRQVSMATFIVAMVGAIYLYKRNGQNDRWIAVFAATIGMIQLAEFFMWSDQTCGSINKYASIFALLILAMEPMMAMLGGIFYSNTPNKPVLKVMLITYILFIATAYFTQIHNKPRTWCGTSLCLEPNPTNGFISDKACNLQWYFLNNIDTKVGILWVMFLVVPFLAMTPRYQGIILFALGLITFGIAKNANNAAQGSLWCWLSIGIILYKILAH